MILSQNVKVLAF